MIVESCGFSAAHIPHKRQNLKVWCPGVEPIWPCGIPKLHTCHDVAGVYFCPGTLVPPTDIIGPSYSQLRINEEYSKHPLNAEGCSGGC
jgi:hypothetical protein